MKKLLLLTFCFVALAMSSYGEVQSIKVLISPPIYDQEVRAQEKSSFEIFIQNTSKDKIALRSYVRSILMDEAGSLEFVDDPYQKYSCQNWIVVNEKRIQIEPQQSRNVAISYEVPANAGGGHYAAILFEIDEDENAEQRQVALQIRTGTMIMLSVRNTIKLAAELSTFKIRNDAKQTLFEVGFTNSSNRHIKPDGSIVIMEGNRVIDRIKFEDSTFMLPESERLLTCVWTNPRKRKPSSTYTAECRFYVKGLGKSLTKKITFTTPDF